MQCILLPLADGKLLHDQRGHTPSAYVQSAHEALIDLCLLPNFLQDAYAALDCRIECSNLFESMFQVWLLPCVRFLVTTASSVPACLRAWSRYLTTAASQHRSV